MKALILAAGLGTRLCPITDNIPKPLVVLGDQPLLWYHLESLRKNGVTEVLINTHYLPEMINGFVADYNNNHQDIKVFTTHEKELLGSAGTLKKNIDFFKDEQDFFVTYGDNLTTIDYDKILDFHVKNNTLATIASYHEKHPESKGIIIHDKNKKIIKFIEKPSNEEIVSNQANGGVYVLNSKIFSYLDKIDSSVIDFGKDLFPLVLNSNGDMFTYEMDEFLLDIGTIENYELAQEKIKELKF